MLLICNYLIIEAISGFNHKINQQHCGKRHEDQGDYTQNIRKCGIGELIHDLFIVADMQHNSDHYR